MELSRATESGKKVVTEYGHLSSSSFSPLLFFLSSFPLTDHNIASFKMLVLLLVFIEFNIPLKAWELNALSSCLFQKKKLLIKVFSFPCDQ
jgi:hypothetical protein